LLGMNSQNGVNRESHALIEGARTSNGERKNKAAATDFGEQKVSSSSSNEANELILDDE